jgi:hypothetical protein
MSDPDDIQLEVLTSEQEDQHDQGDVVQRVAGVGDELAQPEREVAPAAADTAISGSHMPESLRPSAHSP